MFATYKAVLHGDRLEWQEPPPESVFEQRGVPVYVTFVQESDEEPSRGEQMAAILASLAELDGAFSFGDPIVWQREIREDRPL
jgi:hypothetical protein